ncbi:hypothetical protein [Micromonospora lupini]|uniref:hypothetical protein n=1 Tax=Micromonospora lupini TaxID=285679 RepID=UPI002250DEF8|nr:hypothetical protein [Micromonospora lupini]
MPGGEPNSASPEFERGQQLPYQYLVSYAAETDGGRIGLGHLPIGSSSPATDQATINEFRHTISRAENFPADRIAVLNFWPLSQPYKGWRRFVPGLRNRMGAR